MSNSNIQAASTGTNSEAQHQILALLNALDQVILGKATQNRLALTCLLANGHLLIEDKPGMGKTTLANALAKVLGLDFSRIQFTSDMLPADVLGVSIYVKETGEFRFHRGPVFAELVLADEINRTTPKTQSALLEAMEERQVSIDSVSHALPSPHFVIATQNPSEQVGTYPLPESQLDRFLMRIELGYPDRDHERVLLTGMDRRTLLSNQEAVISKQQLLALQAAVHQVHVSDALLDYHQNLVEFSRQDARTTAGISPRASLVLLLASRAWAMVHQRSSVIPEDVQAVLGAVVNHRMQFANVDADTQSMSVSGYLIESVAIP